MRAFIIAIAFVLLGCVPTIPEEDKPCHCYGPPYSKFYSPGFQTWASPDCTGDWARGALHQNRPCVQFQPLSVSAGEVYCVDLGSPVDTIYYKDPSDQDACKPWALTTEPWFIWRSCGFEMVSDGEPILAIDHPDPCSSDEDCEDDNACIVAKSCVDGACNSIGLPDGYQCDDDPPRFCERGICP